MADIHAELPLATKPVHVPDALVYRFDYNRDTGFAKAPHQRAAELLAKAPPIFWTPHNGGHWMILRHRIALDALRETDRLSSEFISRKDYQALMASWPEELRAAQPIPITVDPPDHSRLRAPLAAAFTPSAVNAMQKNIAAFAAELVDRVVPKGHCDFMPEVAEVYPVEIFLKLFGLPVEREREYRDIAKYLLSVVQFDFEANARRNRLVADLMRSTLIDRRDNPKDDLISRMWQFEPEGEPISLDLMESYCIVLFLGGLDTVVNALGFGVIHLAQHTELQQRLRDETDIMPNVVEDLLRRYSIVSPIRHSTRDQTFHGVEFRKGELVMVFTPSTAIDDEAFPEPDRLRLEKRNIGHLTFGGGPHFCLGAHLARMELAAMYHALVTRLPAFRIDPDYPPTFHGGLITGPTSLNLRWD